MIKEQQGRIDKLKLCTIARNSAGEAIYNLVQKNFTGDDMEEIVREIKSLTNIKGIPIELSISLNAISDKGCLVLTRASINTLRQISLAWNSITAKGCKYFCKGTFPDLNSLNLYGNKLGDEGCKHLSKHNWGNLRCLYLVNNIGENGCKHLSKMAFRSDFLSLLLDYNPIGVRGAKYLEHMGDKVKFDSYL